MVALKPYLVCVILPQILTHMLCILYHHAMTEKEYLCQSKRLFGSRLKEHQKAVSSLDKVSGANQLWHVCHTKHAWQNSKVILITINNLYGQRRCLKQWRAGRGGGGGGGMAPPAKDFRGRKTCKKGRQMHEMEQER